MDPGSRDRDRKVAGKQEMVGEKQLEKLQRRNYECPQSVPSLSVL